MCSHLTPVEGLWPFWDNGGDGELAPKDRLCAIHGAKICHHENGVEG